MNKNLMERELYQHKKEYLKGISSIIRKMDLEYLPTKMEHDFKVCTQKIKKMEKARCTIQMDY